MLNNFLEEIRESKFWFKELTLGRKIFAISCLGTFVSLPWSIKLNGFFLLTGLFFAIYIVIAERIRILDTIRCVHIVSFSYFLLFLICLPFSDSFRLGLFYLEKNITFLYVPFIFSILSILKAKRKIFLIGFSISVIAALVYSYFFAFIRNIEYNSEHHLQIFEFNKWFYSYKLLAGNIPIHPAYLACYVSLVLIYLVIDSNKLKIGLTIVIVFFSITLFQLGARSVLLSTVLFLLLYALVVAYKKRNYRKLYLFILVTIVGFLIIGTNDIISSRLEDMSDFIQGKDGFWGSTSLRLKEWSASFQVWQMNKIHGVAFSDVEAELVLRYKAKGWEDLVNERYNCHNQLLQVCCGSGLIGLFAYFAMNFISIRRSIKRKDIFFIGFIFVFILFSLTESTLEVQKGIVYFNLFNSMLYLLE